MAKNTMSMPLSTLLDDARQQLLDAMIEGGPAVANYTVPCNCGNASCTASYVISIVNAVEAPLLLQATKRVQ